jgi:hypothetical protein
MTFSKKINGIWWASTEALFYLGVRKEWFCGRTRKEAEQKANRATNRHIASDEISWKQSRGKHHY